MKQYDALVLGAGPAGVSAALYLARFGLNIGLVERLAPGGLLLQTFEIDNYPGFPRGIKGYELADALAAQLEPYGNLEHIRGEVKELDYDGTNKKVLVDQQWLETKTVIICSGVRYRKLGLPDEGKFLGRGLSHCALCDGNFFAGQEIGVVGGGNSAVEESLFLAKIVSKLHLFHRRDEFRSVPVYLDRLRAMPNVIFEHSTIITALHGETGLEGVTLKRIKQGTEEFMPLSGLFVFIGFEPAADFIPPTLQLDEYGFIKTDTEMRTNIPGVFAAGDNRSKLCRQVVTAVGDGATAANSAFSYLEHKHA